MNRKQVVSYLLGVVTFAFFVFAPVIALFAWDQGHWLATLLIFYAWWQIGRD